MDRSQFAIVNVSTCCFNWLISFSFCAFNARNRSDSSFIWRMSLTRADFIPWKKKKNPPSIRNSDKCIAKWRLDSGYVRGYHCRVGCRFTRREPANQAVLLWLMKLGHVLPWQVSTYVFHWYVWHVKCITDEKRIIILSCISTRIWSQTRKVKFPPKKDCTADV